MKLKTKKITRKRFRVTRNSKVMHRTQGARHIRRNKSKSRQRRQDKPTEIITRKFSRMVQRFLNT